MRFKQAACLSWGQFFVLDENVLAPVTSEGRSFLIEGAVFVKKIFLFPRSWTHLQSGIPLKSMADPQ